MTYQEAIQYMYDQLPMFHRIGKPAYKADLGNALTLDAYFRHPHKAYKTIHVAGTNGKGSVSHMLAAILQTRGLKTGLFTSPHLKDFRERIKVNGCMIPEDEVVHFLENHKNIIEHVKPSFFEMTSALAFEYFKKAEVDIAVIEVGMGGRLDSTNIIGPVLSVITNIGLDHTEFLGDTISQIAREKAGIIKNNIPVVIGEYHADSEPVFTGAAQNANAPLILAYEKFRADYSLFTSDLKQVFNVSGENGPVYKNLMLDLNGIYQRKNICTVLAAVDALQNTGIEIDSHTIYKALASASEITGLNGRWQAIGFNPLIICDTGHNMDGISRVVEQISTVPYKKLHMVIGFVKDKDIAKILGVLPVHAQYYFTNANIPRALNAEELKSLSASFGLQGNSFSSVNEALANAKQNAGPNDFIFVGGSTFIVAEAI